MKYVHAILLILLFSTIGMATERYTAATGAVSSGTCTTNANNATACTLTYALSIMTPGDILFLRGGTFDGTINGSLDSIDNGTDWNCGSGAICIRPYAAETAILRPGSGNSRINSSLVKLVSKSYIIVDGCPDETLTACTPRIVLDHINTSSSSAENPASVNNSDHIRFKGLEIMNAALGGIELSASAGWNHHIEIQANKVHDNMRLSSVGPPHAIHFGSQGTTGQDQDANIIIEYNAVYDNAGASNSSGIECYAGSGGFSEPNTLKGTIIRNNIVHHNHKGIEVAGGCGNALVYNNIVYANTFNGGSNYQISISGGQDTAVYFNTLAETSDAFIAQSGTAGLIFKNNICRSVCTIGGTTITNLQSSSNGTGTWSNNLINDPLFVGSGIGDFHLLDNSPALGVGVAIGGITTDFDGITRPDPPSAGALEVPSGSDPGDDLFEDFESCTAGNPVHGCNGGTGWTQQWQTTSGSAGVQSSGCSMSGKVLRLDETPEASTRRSFGAKTGNFTIQWAMCSSITNPNSEGGGVLLRDQSGNYQVFVYFRSNGNIETSTLTLTAYSANTIYTIRANVDQSNARVRYSVNGGEFSAWENTQSAFTSLTLFEVDDYSTNTHSLYVDSINDDPGPPQFPPAPVSPVGIRVRVRTR